MNLHSNKADFALVQQDEDALQYHYMKYELGIRYPLSVACFQFISLRQEREARGDTNKS